VEEEPSEPMESVPTDWTFPVLVMEEVSKLSPLWGQVAAHLKRQDVFLSAGQYTCTPDSKPILGPCPEVAMITGQVSDKDNPLSYRRFAEGMAISEETMVI